VVLSYRRKAYVSSGVVGSSTVLVLTRRVDPVLQQDDWARFGISEGRSVVFHRVGF